MVKPIRNAQSTSRSTSPLCPSSSGFLPVEVLRHGEQHDGQGAGPPRVRPEHVQGDKGYDSKAIRTPLRRRGMTHTIPERLDRVHDRLRRGGRGGRPPAFDREVPKHRNVVERRFNRLKQWRGIAARYDKTARTHEAAVVLPGF